MDEGEYIPQRNSVIRFGRGDTERISLDDIVYSKIKCGYSSDSEFVSHLFSLKWRRRSVLNNAVDWNFLVFYDSIFKMSLKLKMYLF